MKATRNLISRFFGTLFLILTMVLVPNMAHAHTGINSYIPYIMLFGLIGGLVTAIVCTIWHFSVQKAILPSCGIFLILVTTGILLLIITGDGGPSTVLSSDDFWSALPMLIMLGILTGGLGCIPLTLGAFAISFVLNGVITTASKFRRKP